MSESIENPSVPEREIQAEKLVTFLDKIKAKEVFDGETNKREFIKNMSFEEFKEWLQRLNGILRDIPTNDRGFHDQDVILAPNPKLSGTFQGLYLETIYTPKLEDKEDLLGEMFTLVQDMANRDCDMTDIAILVSAGVNAIHVFDDGNGRTSRLLNFLLTTDYTGEQEQIHTLRNLLGEKGRLFLNIDPSCASDATVDYMFSNVLKIDVSNKSTPTSLSKFFIGENGKAMEDILKEKIPAEFLDDFQKHIIEEGSELGFFAVYEYLKEKGVLDQVTSPILEDGQLKFTQLRIMNLVKFLKHDDYKELLDRYWKMKKLSVSILMNSLSNPQNYILEGTRGVNVQKGQTIKDCFIRELDRKQKGTSMEVNHENIDLIWTQKDTLPFSTETISQQEMLALSKINLELKKIADQEKAERESLNFDYDKAQKLLLEETNKITQQFIGTPDRPLPPKAIKLVYEAKKRIFAPIIELYRKYLTQTISYLDNLTIWQHKFTTRNEDSTKSEEELADTDSLYYVTKSGQSLRIKKYDLIKNWLSQSIQPFMEKIFFTGEDQASSDIPETRRYVVEYYTDEFISDQTKADATEFKSRIRKYEKDGKTIYLNPIDGHMHRGYPINRIL
jgi:hypothetical protein